MRLRTDSRQPDFDALLRSMSMGFMTECVYKAVIDDEMGTWDERIKHKRIIENIMGINSAHKEYA